MAKGRYTHGGHRRGTNRKAGGITSYVHGHRQPRVGHHIHPMAVHGTKRAT